MMRRQLRNVAGLLVAVVLATSVSGCAMAWRGLTIISALDDLAEHDESSIVATTQQQGLVEAVVTGTGGEGLWLRGGPGVDPLIVVGDGTVVVVDCHTDGPTVANALGETSTWSHVTTPQGDTGYMSNGYLDVDPGAPTC